jgi:uncharacterized protein
MTSNRTALIALGGFAGSGKTTVARRLARHLKAPWLCSDTIGAPIRHRLRGEVAAGDAYSAGYEVLFALTAELLSDGCSVVTDMSMGWHAQWERLDAIHAEAPDVTFLPILLRCPYDTCVERIANRHKEDPDKYPPVERFMNQPQLTQVWEYLEAVDRPDVHIVDSSQDIENVFAETWRHIGDQLCSRRAH